MSKKILFFDVVLKERIWGGTDLQALYRQNIDKNIGEAWILSGHHEGETKVSSGVFMGQKLNDLYLDHKELFGESYHPKFPLLIKIIDAKDDLSVQVHPDDDYAFKYHNDYGKNECWYILDAKEDAKIIYGHNATSREEFEEHINNNTWKDVLNEVKVQKGDFFFVPTGTVHAIGKGIKILEVQQSSDVTYRLYDYDRVDSEGKPRTLHIQESLDVINYQKTVRNELYDKYKSVTRFISNEYFTVDKIDLKGDVEVRGDNTYTILFSKDSPLSIGIDGVNYLLPENLIAIVTAQTKDFTLSGNTTCFLIREKEHKLSHTYTF